ncbi:hypothetical protein KTS45_08085 [Halomicroarcula limicola]|uniref:DUF7573 domain-containing protein n=1 Tax=Haloarcula limicola TaxID=1429915 RepID=A0A8J8C4I8_9EURY|nr:hypothetical protein [Halomicroarcula limicola]MBV0924164.1 hypothetical protein [Halomicroarcula limicola]
MSEDTSLDQFLGDGDDDAEAGESEAVTNAESEARTDGADGTAEAESGEEVAAATTTYAWSGEGAACGACGETVERRWQQDGSLVCSDCKEWDRS